MKVWSVMVRLVLSSALILNGVGGAFAATRMQIDQRSAEQAAGVPKAVSVQMPCHQHQMLSQTAGKASSGPAEPLKAPAPDCCKGGACTCACTHMAQVGVAVVQTTTPFLRRGLAVKALRLGHAAPPLPLLIRPPIG